jgi:hypothetical protein
MTGWETAYQWISDLGYGFVTDPDMVVEAGVMVAASVASGGIGAVAGGAAKVSSMALKAKRMSGIMQMTGKGINGFAQVLSTTGRVAKNMQKAVPTVAFEELVVPAVRAARANRTAIKIGTKTDDRQLKLAGTLLEEIEGAYSTPSVILSTAARAFATDSPTGWKTAIAANAADGFVGELFAYAHSQDEIYNYQRLVNGTSINRDDFQTTLRGYAESGLAGAIFGGALGGTIRLGTNAIQQTGGFLEFIGNYGGPEENLRGLFRAYREINDAQVKMGYRQSVFQRLSDVTGEGKLHTAKDFFKERMKLTPRALTWKTLLLSRAMIWLSFPSTSTSLVILVRLRPDAWLLLASRNLSTTVREQPLLLRLLILQSLLMKKSFDEPLRATSSLLKSMTLKFFRISLRRETSWPRRSTRLLARRRLTTLRLRLR